MINNNFEQYFIFIKLNKNFMFEKYTTKRGFKAPFRIKSRYYAEIILEFISLTTTIITLILMYSF